MNENETNNTAEINQEQQVEKASETNDSTASEIGTSQETTVVGDASKSDVAEIARLKAEIARLNSKADTLAKENSDQKKELRSYKSAEQIREEERKEAEDALKKELEELRKERNIAKISKAVYALAQDDTVSAKIAEYLHGAEDPEAAIAEFKKIQESAIKKLKIEYGKIPAPGVGGADGPMYTKEQFDSMKYSERLELAQKHPEEYNRLMGRK